MPSQAINKPPTPGREASPTAMIDVQTFRAFVNSDSFPNIQYLHNEIESLKTRNAALANANDTNEETHAERRHRWTVERKELQQKLREEASQRDDHLKSKDAAEKELRREKDASVELRRRIDELDAKIRAQIDVGKKKELEITGLRNARDQKAADLDKEKTATESLKNELEATQGQLNDSFEQLHAANGALTTIQSFVVNLDTLANKSVQLEKAFADTFRQALDFFHSALYCDLAEDLLTDGFHDLPLPLPASNTPVAKQMRVVAGLMVCGRALADHVFRQTYLMKDKDTAGLDEVLQQLADENPRQEAYLRSVLLRVLPEKQRMNRQHGVMLAMQQISEAVGKWSQNADAFQSGLRSVCEKASTSWQMVLEVEERIIPSFAFEVGEEWQQFPMSQAQGSSRQGPPNQSKSQARSQKQQQSGGPSSRPDRGSLTRNKVANVIWPVFLAAGAQDPDAADATVVLVIRGCVLTKAQAQDAEEEISIEDSSHRLARQSSRRSQPAVRKKRQNSAGFLSTQESGGSDGK